jgi:hypothetical protein
VKSRGSLLDPDLVALILGALGIFGTLAAVALTSTLSTGQWKRQFVLQRKLETINEFLVALMASHRVVKARIVFTDQSTPQEVDLKIETTVTKFQRASIYFDSSDYPIMEGAWLKEKSFISAWKFGLQIDLVNDVDELDHSYTTAYERLRSILTSV